MTSRYSALLIAGSILGLASFAAAASGPQHKSLRPLAMGNAFVAVVDDKDALYYNPAGLNLINSLGNKNRRPNQADYPRNRLDARLNIPGIATPLQDYTPFYNFYKNHEGSFGGLEEIKADSTFREDMATLDGRAIPINVMGGVEFAMNNYGAAYWMNMQITPLIHANPLFPTPEVRDVTVDQVIQIAAAHGFMRQRLAVGLGYRLVNRQEIRNLEIPTDQMTTDSGRTQVQEDLLDTALSKMKNLSDIGSYGHGVDVGALWQQNSWLRFGASVQNLGLYLNHEYITPKVTVGLAITPPLLSSNGVFARKINVALDYEDALNKDRNYKALSKVNFGAEIEQYAWHFFSLRVAGGFKGGYWTAGGGVSVLDFIHIDAVSWADEGGYYTGQIENRLYAVNLGLGF
jgi:hypothetical protein